MYIQAPQNVTPAPNIMTGKEKIQNLNIEHGFVQKLITKIYGYTVKRFWKKKRLDECKITEYCNNETSSLRDKKGGRNSRERRECLQQTETRFYHFFIAKLTLDTVNIDISGDLDNRPFVKHWTFGIHNCRLVKDYRRRKKTETNINPWQCWYEA